MAAPPPSSALVPWVTLQFFTITRRAVPRALWRMAADRRPLRQTPHLRFFKLLGTGDGRTFDLRDADPRTWGLLTVWDEEVARRRFLERSVTVEAWRRLGAEEWRVDLRPVRSVGTWTGQNPFAPRPPSGSGRPSNGGQGQRDTGAVAAITRARLRPRTAAAFWRAVPPVTRALHRAPGRLLSIGIGEAPIGLQGTFSVWRDEPALLRFAYDAAAHRHAIAETRRLRWYSEDLFARFEVVAAQGTLHGHDPLAGATNAIP